MSSSVVHKIQELALPIAEANQAFIVDVRLRGERGGKVVEVFVDADSGVSTDLCATISRELSRALDVANIIQGRFYLVVSSPGIDRPLKFHRQYSHNVGRTLTVTHTLNDQLQKSTGTLTGVSPESIELRLEDASQVTLRFRDIVEAYVNTAW